MVGEGEGYPFEVVVVEELGSDAFAYGTMHTSRSKEGDKLTTLRVDARQPAHEGRDHPHPDRPGRGPRLLGRDRPPGLRRRRRRAHRPRASSGGASRVISDLIGVQISGRAAAGRPPVHPGRTVSAARVVPSTKQVSEGVQMRTRSRISAAATLGAVAVLTAGCLSEEGGGGGGSDNTSDTIEVMYAFSGGQEKRLQGRGREHGRRRTAYNRSTSRRPATSTS